MSPQAAVPMPLLRFLGGAALTLVLLTVGHLLGTQQLEAFRVVHALTGAAATGAIMMRLVGRWELMSDLSRAVVSLLAASTATFALGTARASQLEAPYNELGAVAFAVEALTLVVCWRWSRWIDPTGARR